MLGEDNIQFIEGTVGKWEYLVGTLMGTLEECARVTSSLMLKTDATLIIIEGEY